MAGINNSDIRAKRQNREPTNRANVYSLKLVKDHVCQDTIYALEYLLQEARRGEVIGLVYGGIFKNRCCITDAVGEGYRDPVFALGLAGFLAKHISRTME